MSCGTGECGCGCEELYHIHIRPELTVTIKAEEYEGQGAEPVLTGNLEPASRSQPKA